MTLEVVDIHNTIAIGLSTAWLNHFFMTDERGDEIRPEYLTTAAVCYAFSDFIHKNNLTGSLTVRAEEQTQSVWIRTLMPLFTKIGNRLGHKKEPEIRKGNVDITLALKGRAICELPFGVIENKGFLLFTKDQQLYKGSHMEVEKDLTRNIEFVSGFNDYGIEYAGFTFYLRDSNSVLESEGAIFCQNKKKYFDALCKRLIPPGSGLSFKVGLKTIESNLFSSSAAAEDVDENGCPAYVRDRTWNIVGGVISIYRIGTSVTYHKSF